MSQKIPENQKVKRKKQENVLKNAVRKENPLVKKIQKTAKIKKLTPKK